MAGKSQVAISISAIVIYSKKLKSEKKETVVWYNNWLVKERKVMAAGVYICTGQTDKGHARLLQKEARLWMALVVPIIV